jgi:hypothetical protein
LYFVLIFSVQSKETIDIINLTGCIIETNSSSEFFVRSTKWDPISDEYDLLLKAENDNQMECWIGNIEHASRKDASGYKGTEIKPPHDLPAETPSPDQQIFIYRNKKPCATLPWHKRSSLVLVDNVLEYRPKGDLSIHSNQLLRIEHMKEEDLDFTLKNNSHIFRVC